jgi:hypothetical protein
MVKVVKKSIATNLFDMEGVQNLTDTTGFTSYLRSIIL